MSVAESPSRIAQTSDERVNAIGNRRRRTLTIEQALYLALFAVALLTHFWGLGNRALHHDETHHAFFSWQLYTGGGYVHDPLLHGPFLYYVGALIYFLFGDSDASARFGVALFSSVLVVLPYFIRRELGRGAALLAALYLLVSPAFLYVGRFVRHDPYAVTFELLSLIGIVRYAATQQVKWLYLVAAALALMFTTMETFFLYVAIFGSLLVLLFVWRTWWPGVVLAATAGLAIIALVFVLPGEPLRQASGDDAVQRAHGPYVCPSPGDPSPPDNPLLFRPGPIFGFGPLATADNNYALCVRHQPDNNFGLYMIKLGQFFSHPAILIAVGVAVASLALFYLFVWHWRGAGGLTAWERARARHDSVVEAFASLALGRRGLVALAIFAILYALFFSAFLTNPAGIVSGASGSLLYWLAQHGVQRGNQPGYYYFVLLAIYEPLVLVWSGIGLVMVGFLAGRRIISRPAANTAASGAFGEGGLRRTPPIDWAFAMPVLLAWWAILTLFIYSWAGEKMPWLTIHVALPLVLLAAWALARALHWGLTPLRAYSLQAGSPTENGVPSSREDTSANGQPPPGLTHQSAPRRPLLLYLISFGVIAGYGFMQLSDVTAPDRGLQSASVWIVLLTLVAMAIITILYGLLRGGREALGALVLAVTLIGGLYTARSAYQLSYRWGDIPREMLIYTQTSPDVARVIERLKEASIRRTGGLSMPIWYDNETVWNWYTRNFVNRQEQSPALNGPPGSDVMAVLMLKENIDTYPQNLQNLKEFRIQRYPLRWWFPEEQTYRLPADWRTAPVDENSPLLMRLLRTPTDGKTIAQTWQFLMYRQTPAPLGSTDFILAVRPEVADEIGLGTGAGGSSR